MNPDCDSVERRNVSSRLRALCSSPVSSSNTPIIGHIVNRHIENHRIVSICYLLIENSKRNVSFKRNGRGSDDSSNCPCRLQRQAALEQRSFIGN